MFRSKRMLLNIMALTIGLWSGSTWAAFCDTLPKEALAPWLELIMFEPGEEIAPTLNGDVDCWGGPRTCVQQIEEAAGELSLDYYTVTIRALPEGFTAEQLLSHVRLNLNDFVNTRVTYFEVWDADEGRYDSNTPIGSRVHIEIGRNTSADLSGDFSSPLINPDDAAVVLSDYSSRHWRFTTITAPRDGYHPVSGHREWGFFENGDGSYTFYNRGVDRPTTDVDATLSPTVFYWQDFLWRSLQHKLAQFVNDQGGAAVVAPPSIWRFDWEEFANCLEAEIAERSTETAEGIVSEIFLEFDIQEEHLFQGCPGREDIKTTAGPNFITFEWIRGDDAGEFITFAWGTPYLEDQQIKIDYRVEAESSSPPGFTLSPYYNDQLRLPPVSARTGWRREATATAPANLDFYEIDLSWSPGDPFGYGCGPVSTVAHRYILTRIQ